METSIENYRKLKKQFIDNLVENDIKTEQRIMETKENELKFLLRINDMNRKSTNKDLENM
jgi:hypothetical protein